MIGSGKNFKNSQNGVRKPKHYFNSFIQKSLENFNADLLESILNY